MSLRVHPLARGPLPQGKGDECNPATGVAALTDTPGIRAVFWIILET